MPEQVIIDQGHEWVIDEETGEIIQWPEGLPHNINVLLERAFYADSASKAWAAAGAAYRAVIRREMESGGQKKIVGGPGSAIIIERTTTKVPGGTALAQWIRDHEPPHEFFQALPQAIATLNPEAWRLLMQLCQIPESEGEKLVEIKVSTFLQLRASTPPPPTIKVRD